LIICRFIDLIFYITIKGVHDKAAEKAQCKQPSSAKPLQYNTANKWPDHEITGTRQQCAAQYNPHIQIKPLYPLPLKQALLFLTTFAHTASCLTSISNIKSTAVGLIKTIANLLKH